MCQIFSTHIRQSKGSAIESAMVDLALAFRQLLAWRSRQTNAQLFGATVVLALSIRQLLAWHRRRKHGLNIHASLCLVTGASSGVGAATAVELARKGAATVLLIARNRERLEEVAGRVREAGAKAEIFCAELSDPVAVGKLAANILATQGTPSLIVHAAGAGRWRRLTEMSAQQASILTPPRP